MIQITGLTKAYRRGRPPAVLDLSFDARPGMVTALLGDEGAGKSTALRLMVELERGHGLTLFDGRTYRRIRRPEREIGVLLSTGRPEAGHPGQRARAHLRMLAGTVGVPARRADDLLEQTRLAAVADHRLGTFSPGMHRRLALAAALLGNPSTLLLDAPTEGLSPSGEEWFRAFLRSFALSGGTVLTTTRAPEEAAGLADRVVTLDAGRLAADQPVVEFRRTRLHPEVLVRGPQMARLADLLTAQGGQVRHDGGAGLAVSGIGRTEIGELAYRNGILLHELADRVVERPVSYPSALPSSSGRSGQVLIRTATDPGERPPAGQRPVTIGRPAGPERPLDHRGLQAGRWAAAALAPNPVAPEQGQGQEREREREETRGEGQGASLPAPTPSAPTPPTPTPAPPAAVVPAPSAPAVDLTRRTSRTPGGASALGHPEARGAARPARPVAPEPAAATMADAEQLAANPTDAELLTPARIRGVGHQPAPVRPFAGRPWPAPADAAELRAAEPAESAGPAARPRQSAEPAESGTGTGTGTSTGTGTGTETAARRAAVGDENGSE
ncbi:MULTISPECIES: ATP-binding cassette domain-containing protein [Kitasatospora]|uniref:Putative ABC transporter ATP-binding protein n=1 Tax=Kitasatospora setae (strain ATCC 33774 / DSM 43861 / JCM 3304 / KCC A-0304 / NBRC 14216 / KM-6054) TaxID=452652 RepID=E4NI48_KITSK|nr:MULTISPECIES: ATP-binding cassette domain-containing protein [Kitasatospora]BAJ31178.1 putative ABC transporter ATP-binding protein [Kitasatospora setae KM-6054]